MHTTIRTLIRTFCTATLLLATLSACGNKGPLYVPSQEVPPTDTTETLKDTAKDIKKDNKKDTKKDTKKKS